MGALGHGDTPGLSVPGQVAVRSSNDWHGIKNHVYAISFPSHFAIVALATRGSIHSCRPHPHFHHALFSPAVLSLVNQEPPLPNWLGVAVYFAGQSARFFRSPGLDST